MLLAATVVLVAVPFLALLLLVEERSSVLRGIDDGARDGLHGYGLRHPLFVSAMRLLATVGSSAVWTLTFLPVVAWLLWRRSVRLAVFVVITVEGSTLLNNVVKLAVHRARPVLRDPLAHAGGASFPSGHAQAAIVGYGVLVLLFRPAWRGVWRQVFTAAAAGMVLAIGFSRVALGVHFVSDVLAAYVLGVAWLTAMTAAFTAWRRDRGLPSRDVTGSVDSIAAEGGLQP